MESQSTLWSSFSPDRFVLEDKVDPALVAPFIKYCKLPTLWSFDQSCGPPSHLIDLSWKIKGATRVGLLEVDHTTEFQSTLWSSFTSDRFVLENQGLPVLVTLLSSKVTTTGIGP